MSFSKPPQPAHRPAWSIWGARVCLFSGALLLFGSLVPPILTEVNATIRATAGNTVRREPVQVKTTEATPSSSQIERLRPMQPPAAATLQRTNQSDGLLSDREEILSSYQKWKQAWFTGDLKTCMSLYAHDIQFSDIGRRAYDYEGLKTWFKGIWGGATYRVMDWEPPLIRIRGKRALMITKQGYGQRRAFALTFINRYVWEKRAMPGSNKQRWLIVEEAYLPFNGDRGNQSQIY